MKLIRKVSTIEVKRCFVLSQLIRWKKRYKGHLKSLTREDFFKRLAQAKKKLKKLKEKDLDRIIKGEWEKRLIAYNASNWFLGEARVGEIGVWKRAGGMPLRWTNNSLADTARHVKFALKRKALGKKGRAIHALPNILKTNVDVIQSEKYLLPIIFKSNTGTRGRKNLKRIMKGDLDDGCMRSVALAVNGAKIIRAYIGFPKIKTRT
jgi:hypothetical protein